MDISANTKKNYARLIITVTSILSLGYAVIRYHIAGDVPWKDFPFYIFNKGISLSGFLILTLNFTLGPLKNLNFKIGEGWLNARPALGMIGFLFILIHILISFLLFRPEIYGKFFEPDGSLTLFAGLSMLGGVLSFVTLLTYNLSFKMSLKEDKSFVDFITSRKTLLISMLFSLAHIFFMGFKGWMDPSGWNGGLPPITLIAFVFFSVGYLINLLGRK